MNKIVICVLFLGLFGIAQSLRISGHFVENFGWQIYVGWTRTTASHVMENITITRNENEVLVVYVPATHGTTYNASIVNVDSNTNTSISCLQELSAISGICNLSVEVTGPPTDDTYTAIAYWAMNPGTLRGNSTETIIGKASTPKITVIKIAGQRDNLNCTATGVPAPTFVWTLEADNTTVLADSVGTVWNNLTRLYDSWSLFKPTNQSSQSFRVVCTPRQINRRGEVILGSSLSRVINSANQFGASVISSAVLLALAFSYSGSV